VFHSTLNPVGDAMAQAAEEDFNGFGFLVMSLSSMTT
jgi:hypothetical protein